MSTSTSRLALLKPDPTENINVTTALNNNLDKLDAVAGYAIVTAATRPAAPFNGQGIRESDTGKLYVHNGTSPASAGWVQVANAKSMDWEAASVLSWNANDTRLYRAAAGDLRTDGTFRASSLSASANLTVSGSASITGNVAVGGSITGSYAPTITSFTPSIASFTAYGTGAIREGFYIQLGKLVIGWFRIQLGTSPVASGVLQFQFPVAPYSGFSGTSFQATVGSWTMRDTSAGDHFTGNLATYDGSAGVAPTGASFGGAWNGTKPSIRATNTIPFVPAVDDVISGQFIYRTD